MKSFFITVFFIAAALSKAQPSDYCYNGGIASPQAETKEKASTGPRTTSLILMPYVMNQKEVLLVLKEKNNLKINSFLRKSALYTALQRIGFLGIPTGIIGAACLVSVNVSGSLISGTNMQQQNVGLGFVALGAACLGSGVYFNIERKKNYKKAIRKYNQLYN